jgi:hypothetical protein
MRGKIRLFKEHIRVGSRPRLLFRCH